MVLKAGVATLFLSNVCHNQAYEFIYFPESTLTGAFSCEQEISVTKNNQDTSEDKHETNKRAQRMKIYAHEYMHAFAFDAITVCHVIHSSVTSPAIAKECHVAD